MHDERPISKAVAEQSWYKYVVNLISHDEKFGLD